MADAELGALLEPHKNTLKEIAQGIASGNGIKVASAAATLVAALASGHPEVMLLAPFAEQAIAKAFGRSADAMLGRELAALEAVEDRQKFAAQIAEPIEALIGQALIQLARIQHRTTDEVLENLGGLRDDLAAFREQFTQELDNTAVKVDRLIVKSGATGVRVSPQAKKCAFISYLEASGNGSIGIDLR
jgi:hypothetical protein